MNLICSITLTKPGYTDNIHCCYATDIIVFIIRYIYYRNYIIPLEWGDPNHWYPVFISTSVPLCKLLNYVFLNFNLKHSLCFVLDLVLLLLAWFCHHHSPVDIVMYSTIFLRCHIAN